MNDRNLDTPSSSGAQPDADAGPSRMLGLVLLAILAGAALALLAIILGLGLFWAAIVYSFTGVLTLMLHPRLPRMQVSRRERLGQTESGHPNQN